MDTERQQVEQSVLAITQAIGTDIAYLENDEMGHFDPITLVASAAALLLTAFFEGARDAAKDGGKRVGVALTERISRLFSSRGTASGSAHVIVAAQGVSRAELQRYGDVAQSLVQAALVENGLPLRKAESLASTIRSEADRIAARASSQETK
jgi:hypothetical protein